MSRRVIAMFAMLFLLCNSALADELPAVPKSPQPLGITLQQFVDTYNALPTVTRKLDGQSDDLQQVFGLVSMPAGEQMDVYVQLSYDEPNDAVQFAGVVTQLKENRLDFEGFLLVCDHLMEIVFPEMSPDARKCMLMQVILNGAVDGIYFPDGSNVYNEGDNSIMYVVREDGERHVIVYQQK